MIKRLVNPYVYKLIHKETGQFYIGYRHANKVPAELDLGLVYKTSSNKVKSMGIDNFDKIILVECINPIASVAGNDAYDIENDLISDNFDDPLCMNEHYRKYNGEARFKSIPGAKRTRDTVYKPISDETRAKMSASQKILQNSPEHKVKHIAKMNTPEVKAKLAKALEATYKDPERNKKISDTHKGKLHAQDHNDKIKAAMNKPETIAALAAHRASDKFKNSITDVVAKRFHLVSPDGTVYEGKGISKFCIEHNLSSSILTILQGKQKSSKGWTGHYII